MSSTKAKRLYLTINKLMELIEDEIHKNTNNELFNILEFMDNMNNRTFANYRNHPGYKLMKSYKSIVVRIGIHYITKHKYNKKMVNIEPSWIIINTKFYHIMTLLKLFNCSNLYISVPIHSHHHKLHKLNEHFEDTHDILYQTQQIINIIIYLKYYTKNNGDFTTYYETFNNPITDNQLCEFCDSIYHKYKYDYDIFDLEDEFND